MRSIRSPWLLPRTEGPHGRVRIGEKPLGAKSGPWPRASNLNKSGSGFFL